MKMKKLAILFLSTVLFGCRFNSSSVDDNSYDGDAIIEISINDASVKRARSAIPVIDAGETISYSVVARKGAETVGPVKQKVSGTDIYHLAVTPGEWVVSVTGTSDSTGDDILFGTRTVKVSENGKYGAVVAVQYIVEEGISSGVDLNVQFGSLTRYPSIARMTISGTGTSLDGGYIPNGLGSFHINKADVPTGNYNPIFKFYDSLNASDSNLICVITERISVRKNRTTKTWIKNGTETWLKDNGSGVVFELSDDVIDSIVNKTFFVKGTGGTLTATASDDNSGTWAAPFKTVQKAIDKVMAINDGTSTYTVYVDGEVLAESTAPLININGTYLKLNIQGFNGNPAKDILHANKNSGTKAVSISLTANNPNQMYINFSNLKITGGYSSTFGIYVQKPAVVFTNCIIEGNYVNGASPNGFIYALASSITFDNTQVKNNFIKERVCGTVYCFMGTTVGLTGKNYIYDNHAINADETDTGTQENFIVSSTAKIKILGDITGSKIGIFTTENIEINNPLEFTENFNASGTTAKPSQIFFSDQNYTVGYDSTCSEAAMTLSSYTPTIQMHEDVEVRCGTSILYDPSVIGDASGRTVSFKVYNKSTGTDVTDSANLNFTVKYLGSSLSSDYVTKNASSVVFNTNVVVGFYHITVEATVNGTKYISTHPVEIKEIPLATELASVPNNNAVFGIASQADMVKLATWVQGQPRTYTVYLLKDITLSGFSTISRTSGTKSFTGTFDGNGHTITVTNVDRYYQGLFYNLGDNTTNTTIKNLTMAGDVSVDGDIGGFVTTNSNKVRIENCVNKMNIESSTKSAAGFYNTTNNNYKITIINCLNTGNITALENASGIANGRADIYNCKNTGSISAKYAGGITYDGSANSCVNRGNVSASMYYAGGISAYSARVINCINYGVIEGKNSAGGIQGFATPPNVKNCINLGKVINLAASTNKGAIIGGYGQAADNITNNFFNASANEGVSGIGSKADLLAPYVYPFTTDGYASRVSELVTIGTFNSFDVVSLLNEWVKQNPAESGAPAYSKWTYDSNGLPKLMCEE